MQSLSERTPQAIFQDVMQLLPGLALMLGPHQEVILHDLRRPDSSIIGICGSVTGRTIGSPITNYVLQTIKTFGNSSPDRINYRTETQDGKVLRSSTIFIRDDQGTIIGCLCFNCDITPYIEMSDRLQELTSFSTVVPMESNTVEEHFAMDVFDMMKDLVKKALDKRDISNLGMSKSDKMQIVQELEENGVFNIRGAVEHVATCLHVSVPTVYNYLKQIREDNRSSPAAASSVSHDKNRP